MSHDYRAANRMCSESSCSSPSPCASRFPARDSGRGCDPRSDYISGSRCPADRRPAGSGRHHRSFFHPAQRQTPLRVYDTRPPDPVSPRMVAELGKCAQAANRFGAQVDIVGQVAGKVIRAKLVLRDRIPWPSGSPPISPAAASKAGKVGVAFHLGDAPPAGSADCPLSSTGIWFFFGAFAAAIDLAIGLRICAQGHAARRGTSSAPNSA